MGSRLAGRAFDPATIDFYEREAPDYVASGIDGTNRHLPGFLARLTPGSRILELGCGGGRDAAHMLARGFDVEATDGVPAMAALASRRLGRAVRVMRFDQLDACECYDAVYASASLLHVPRSGLPDAIERVWNALKPGGWHFASFKGGGAEARDRLGRLFNFLDASELREVYCDGREWSRLETTEGEGGGYDGRRWPWTMVTARKAP